MVGRLCATLGASLTMLLVLAPAALADLAPGTWAFDGEQLTGLERDDATGDLYVSGNFTGQAAPTGGGLLVPADGDGSVDLGTMPKVAGHALIALPDGAGGFVVGGLFTGVDGMPARNLAHIRADGTPDPAFTPPVDGQVVALARVGSTLYLGGEFSEVAGEPRRNIAAVNTSTGALEAFDSDADRPVLNLEATASTVYASGQFTQIGGQARSRFAALDSRTGAAQQLDLAPDSHVSSLALSGTTLYLGGGFTEIGGQPRGGGAAIDTATGELTSFDPKVNDFGISSLVAAGDTLYVAGLFTSVGSSSVARDGLAAFDLATGEPTGFAPELTVNGTEVELGASPTTLYAVGGALDPEGGARRSFVALDRSTGDLEPMDVRPGSIPRTVAVSGSDLYVGGRFTTAGPELANIAGLARVHADGTLDTDFAPQPKLEGDSEPPAAIALAGTTLYASGRFQVIAGAARHRLAAIDITTGRATAFRPEIEGQALDLAFLNGTLYLGGIIDRLGGEPRNDLGAVDGVTGAVTGFDPAANGITGPNLLAASPDGLPPEQSVIYVNRGFGMTEIGGQPATALNPLDPETGERFDYDYEIAGGGVSSVHDTGPALYLTGSFTSVLGEERGGAAAFDFDANELTAFDPRPDDLVIEVRETGGRVYLAGRFSQVAGQPRAGAASFEQDTLALTSFAPTVGGQAGFVEADGDAVHLGGSMNSIGARVTGPLALLDADTGEPQDTIAPTIRIGTPAAGQRVQRGADVASDFRCDDSDGSGVALCDGPARLDTETTGTKTLTVTSRDRSGNERTASVAYVVEPEPASPQMGDGAPASDPGGGAQRTDPGGGVPLVNAPSPRPAIARTAITRRGFVIFRIVCAARTRCRGRLSLATSSRRPGPAARRLRRVIGRTSYTIKPGTSKRIVVTPRRSVRRRLRKPDARLRVVVRLVPAGGGGTVSRRLTLSRR